MSATHLAPHIGLRGRYAFANLITNFHISTIIPEINLKLTDVSGFQRRIRRNKNFSQEWRVKILWNPKMFTIFASTMGSFPLKEILRLREQRF